MVTGIIAVIGTRIGAAFRRRDFVISFSAAVVCHALVLFAFQFKMFPKANPLADEGNSVEINIAGFASAVPSSAPPTVAPMPEVQPPPDPMPAPEPVQDTTPSIPDPAPMIQRVAPTSETAPQARPERPKTRTASAASSKKNGTASTRASSASIGGIAGGTGRDSGPRYRSNPRPDYPSDALRMRREGTVLLNVAVSVEGRVAAASLKRSSGVSSLDQAALDAVRRWTFEPATRAGFPVPAEVEVPVRFTLERATR